ncbi:hypothetical protein OIE82_16325 [Streptomyces althioticus]|jgi:hypothetical protein|uniref:Uncharacterized protein n=1 Tax=Streptomyces althioticus TaxID=83380 RepID=A0ABZ1Y850_9ACTN
MRLLDTIAQLVTLTSAVITLTHTVIQLSCDRRRPSADAIERAVDRRASDARGYDHLDSFSDEELSDGDSN